MDKDTARKLTGTQALKTEIASRSTDPNFYGALNYLPNPDPILRKLNRGQEVFDAIAADAHVIGELRSVRSGLLGFEWRIQSGGDAPADLRALELCQQYMSHKPAPGMSWSDVIWNMSTAVFRGYRVHEVVWKKFDRYILPDKILDRPNNRFTFGQQNDLRLKTRANMTDGEELGNYKWLLTRHMHSFDNPYGVALFSSCFWPYTFKHSGFKYFVKFSEKYGIPFALGKYPIGTTKEQQKELLDGLVQMVEDAVGTIPEGNSIELIETSIRGQLVHENLINACNKEMSKALTSQTLATEIQGEGSRAASETHRDREQGVNSSDRQLICETMNELLAWISEINIDGAVAPYFEFYEESEVAAETVDMIDKARNFIQVPKAWAHERLQIPLPQEGEEVLQGASTPPPVIPPEFNQHTCPGCGQTHEFATGDSTEKKLVDQAVEGSDELLDSLIEPVRKLMEQSNTMEAFRDGLTKIYADIDETKIGEFTALALMTGYLQGEDEA